jgi:hypothetical protein
MKHIMSFKKMRKYNLAFVAFITLGIFSLAPAAAFASPNVAPGGYHYIGQATDSYGVTFKLAVCKVKEGSNITVDSSYSISPVNSTTVEHSSIWEAYSNTKDPNYLDYITANLTAFNSNGTATDSYTAPKTVKTFMYWEGD